MGVSVRRHLFYYPAMQRLFSMFPTGRPGIALVLMRLVVTLLLIDSVADLFGRGGPHWLLVLHAVVGLAFCVGFLTPLASVLLVLIEAVACMSATAPFELTHVRTILEAIALALLGPGAYSLDAWCFGRQQVILDRGPGPPDR